MNTYIKLLNTSLNRKQRKTNIRLNQFFYRLFDDSKMTHFKREIKNPFFYNKK